MRKIFHSIRTRKYRWIAALLILGLLLFFFFPRSKNAVAEEITVRRGTVTQEVTVTGKTKAVTDIDLAFERSGKISRVLVHVGDKIIAGQNLAELNNAELAAQLAEAQATVQIQKAKLAELKRGSRPEDIQIKQTALKKAQQDLTNAYQSVFDVLNDSYVKSDDAVRKQLDDLFTNDEASNPQLTFIVTDSQKQVDAENRRLQASNELKIWKKELDQLITHPNDQIVIDDDIVRVKSHLLLIRDLLDKTMDAVVNNANLSASTATTYKTVVTTARTSVASAITAVSNREQAISSQKITVAQISDELALAFAGSAPEEIAAQEAQVRQAEASAQVTNVQIAKGVIRSPIAGTITRQDAKLGQIAEPNSPLISVISNDELEIEANIPETDAAKTAIGNLVTLTFDAFGDDTKFSGRITFIDPAETIIEGVSTYKTTVHLDDKNPLVKPGLTANLTIKTKTSSNALVIPQQSIVYRGDKRLVLVPHKNGTPTETEITLGVRGSDGMVEVLSGLRENDIILKSPE